MNIKLFRIILNFISNVVNKQILKTNCYICVLITFSIVAVVVRLALCFDLKPNQPSTKTIINQAYCHNCYNALLQDGFLTQNIMLNLIKEFAIKSHEDVNHKYGVYPYSYHLSMVVDVAKEFINSIPEEDREMILSACWMHDTIEDCRLTYNDVKEVAGLKVAEIVYALSNEKGKNRKERANEKYYKGIRETEYACFVKLCDRIANVKHSKKERSKMFDVYKKENENFINQLFPKNRVRNVFDLFALHKLEDVFECDSSQTVL